MATTTYTTVLGSGETLLDLGTDTLLAYAAEYQKLTGATDGAFYLMALANLSMTS